MPDAANTDPFSDLINSNGSDLNSMHIFSKLARDAVRWFKHACCWHAVHGLVFARTERLRIASVFSALKLALHRWQKLGIAHQSFRKWQSEPNDQR